jgi:cell division septal protein FtsQ
LNDQQSQWANATWQGLVESRRKRNRRRGLALGFLGLAIAGLLALVFVQRNAISALPLFSIRVIEVTGNRTITEAEVYDLLDLRAGDPWWNLKPDAVRARVAASPQIAGIEFNYGWFHRLHVGIVEREPVLYVMGAFDGELTRDGWFLPAREGNTDNDLPIFRPAAGSMPMPGSQVGVETAALARLVGDLREKRPDLWRDLSEFELSGGQAYAYLRTRTAVIRFIPGMHDDLWNRIPTVLGDLDRRKRTDVVLDLRFDDRIVVHLPESAVPDTLAADNTRGRT